MIQEQQIEYKDISFFRLYENNPRKNDHAVPKMAEFIKRFGFRIPVLAKGNGVIVDGHLRYKAAKFLGMTRIPYINCDDMSEAEIKAFRISVNKASELADWDLELLEVEFEAINAEGFSVEFTGFDVSEMDSLFPESSPFMNTAPAIPDPPVRVTEANERPSDPPQEFQQFDEDIETDYQCPKCGWAWSGKRKP